MSKQKKITIDDVYRRPIEKIDWVWASETLEKYRNMQCFICGGWATDCPCKENIFSFQEKADLKEFLRLIK